MSSTNNTKLDETVDTTVGKALQFGNNVKDAALGARYATNNEDKLKFYGQLASYSGVAASLAIVVGTAFAALSGLFTLAMFRSLSWWVGLLITIALFLLLAMLEFPSLWGNLTSRDQKIGDNLNNVKSKIEGNFSNLQTRGIVYIVLSLIVCFTKFTDLVSFSGIGFIFAIVTGVLQIYAFRTYGSDVAPVEEAV